MVDNPLSIMDPLRNFFATQSINTAANLFINLVVSTIVGGIVLLIIVEIFGKKWGEEVSIKNAFLVVLFINLINIFGIIGITGTFVAWIPYMLLILPLLVWIGIFKALFSEMSNLHLLMTALIGYAVSIYLVPYLVAQVMSFIPLPV